MGERLVASSRTAFHSCYNPDFCPSPDTRTLDFPSRHYFPSSQRGCSGASSDFLSGGKKSSLSSGLHPVSAVICTDLVCELKSLAEGRACLQLPGTGAIRMLAGGPASLPPTLHPGPQPAHVRWAPGLGPSEMPPTPA